MDREKEQHDAKRRDTVSYEAMKKVEQDLEEIEEQVREELAVKANREKYEKLAGKVFCDNCRFRKRDRCRNPDVMIALGRFKPTPRKCATDKTIPIAVANRKNDCRYFKPRPKSPLTVLLYIFLAGAGLVTLVLGALLVKLLWLLLF
jgi:hypothetical protein